MASVLFILSSIGTALNLTNPEALMNVLWPDLDTAGAWFEVGYFIAIGLRSPAIKGRPQRPRDINSRPAPRGDRCP
jgi:hypothetical protein